MERVRQRCGFLNGIEVSAIRSRDGLCLAWKEEIQVTLESYSQNSITVLTKNLSDGTEWRLTGFYGSPYAS